MPLTTVARPVEAIVKLSETTVKGILGSARGRYVGRQERNVQLPRLFVSFDLVYWTMQLSGCFVESLFVIVAWKAALLLETSKALLRLQLEYEFPFGRAFFRPAQKSFRKVVKTNFPSEN